MKKIILFVLIVFFYNSIFSQNLDKLPEKERNKILIETAKKVVKKHGPGYYREYKKPVITKNIIEKQDGMAEEDKANIGRVFYSVLFPYNRKKEYLNLECAAKISIWADTGKAMSVLFGNGFGLLDIDKHQNIDGSIPRVPYQSVQINFVSMEDYTVRWKHGLTEAQQDSLQKVQDELWIKYEEKEEQLRIEHIRADSLKEVEIMKKYGIEYIKD